ncbi:MAG: cyclic nucleotide-binding domain-containing protein [Opitutales bacterium]|nr:cyclic nucleotide-binding domain-containing protein [Opitutales bacterium]
MIQSAAFHKKLSRINADYFAFPERIFALKKGEKLVREGEDSKRLYLLLSGNVIAYRHRRDESGERIPDSLYQVFRAGPGSYIGVQSFFSRLFRSSCEIVAETNIEVAYIDETVEVVEPEKYGSLIEQFVPTMVHELALRNSRVFEHAAEKEAAIHRMHRSEMSATLGQLAAGLAHELNNAVGVLARKTDFVSAFIEEFLRSFGKHESELFCLGRDNQAVYSSEDLRSRAREYERLFKISQSAAKVLARIAPNPDSAKKLDKKVLTGIEDLARFWEIGHDIRDMQLAAKHAAGIVRSVKILGGGNIRREEGTDVSESISEAVSLLKPQLRGKNLIADLAETETFPKIFGDMTELVQLWVNIIKNACDAMNLAGTQNPTVRILTTATAESVSVAITDNGPGVPDSLKEKIFQPDFSTKKSGLSFGLGLGLAIVRRIVDDYGGTILLDSVPGCTTFTITLPIHKPQ